MNQEEFQKDLYGSSKRSVALRKKFIAKSTLVGERKLGNNNYDDNYNFAITYHRCAAVQQFDDDVAAQEDTTSVFATKNFAIFRICPVDSCDEEGGEQQDEGEEEQQEEGEEDTVYSASTGARGLGCSSNYGEYMIELEDYLQVMAEHQEAIAQQYCAYCEDYMYNVYMNYYSDNSNRDLKFEDFIADGKNRKLSDDDTCVNYGDLCTNGGFEAASVLTEYFECTYANGAYVGPHCSDDGFTITLGAYADSYCNQYIGGDIADYIGQDDDDDASNSYYDLSDDALKSWYNSRVCIPCGQQQAYGSERRLENNDDNSDDTTDLCAVVYDTSAHCDKNFELFSRGNLNDTEWKEMQLSCSFIDSIGSHNYNETGFVKFVNLQNKWWPFNMGHGSRWTENNYAPQSMHEVASDTSLLQVFFLIFSILACIILAVWAKTLHASLLKKRPWSTHSKWNAKDAWSPRSKWHARARGFLTSFFRPSNQPKEVSPAESGIEASRVRSESYYVS